MKCPEEDGLYQEIQSQIAFIFRKKERYTRWKNFARISLLVLSAIITLVAGWDATQSDPVSVSVSSFHLSEGHVILILSTLVTFLTAIEAFFKYSDKASTYGLMHFEFRTLQRKMCYDFEKDAELFTNSKDEYFKTYQDILSSQKELIDNSDS
ncbi:MAG: SLATT domain-containing protein [Crocinitomicaceae bacterium]|nr:SLATT domain-containing protein [Crocinitomicaceae bacterium]